jgi:hypothetical protein
LFWDDLKEIKDWMDTISCRMTDIQMKLDEVVAFVHKEETRERNIKCKTCCEVSIQEELDKFAMGFAYKPPPKEEENGL